MTPENQKITVEAPTNLGDGQLVVIDLINKDGGKIITLAYDVKTNAQGLYLELRDAASQKKFRQQEGFQRAPTKKALRPIGKLTDGVIKNVHRRFPA